MSNVVLVKCWMSWGMLLLVSMTAAQFERIDIKVLAYDRPHSLRRLLRSLQNADLLGDAAHDLDIWIDAPRKHTELRKHDLNIWDEQLAHRVAETVRIARSFEWKHGRKEVHARRNWVGLKAQWLGCYTTTNVRAVILEDDVEVSPYFMPWLQSAIAVFGNREDVAGIALHAPLPYTLTPSVNTPSVQNHHQPFLFQSLGMWGFAPSPKHWKAFLQQQDQISPVVFHNGYELVTTKWCVLVVSLHLSHSPHRYHEMALQHREQSIWTPYFVSYCKKKDLYTLFPNLPDQEAFAINHFEPGEHFSNVSTLKAKRHTKLVKRWVPGVIVTPQKHVTKLDWSAKKKSEHDGVLVTPRRSRILFGEYDQYGATPTSVPLSAHSSAPTQTPSPAPTVVSCVDGILGVNETDIDCGGDRCPPCTTGASCLIHEDCASGVCTDKKCDTASPTSAPTITPTQTPTPTHMRCESKLLQLPRVRTSCTSYPQVVFFLGASVLLLLGLSSAYCFPCGTVMKDSGTVMKDALEEALEVVNTLDSQVPPSEAALARPCPRSPTSAPDTPLEVHVKNTEVRSTQGKSTDRKSGSWVMNASAQLMVWVGKFSLLQQLFSAKFPFRVVLFE